MLFPQFWYSLVFIIIVFFFVYFFYYNNILPGVLLNCFGSWTLVSHGSTATLLSYRSPNGSINECQLGILLKKKNKINTYNRCYTIPITGLVNKPKLYGSHSESMCKHEYTYVFNFFFVLYILCEYVWLACINLTIHYLSWLQLT